MVASRVTGEFSWQPDSAALLITRLTPPPQQARLLQRRRVGSLLAAAIDYPLTLLVAPAGSGKTTALADVVTHGGWPTAWCRMSAADDPALLLRYLAAAFRPVVQLDETRLQAAIIQARGEAQPDSAPDLRPALDLLVNELAAALDDETLLILDDYHLADRRPDLRALMERLIAIQPMRLHLLLSSRYEPELSSLANTRVRGEIYELGQTDLAFTSEEAHALFSLYDHVAPPDVADLTQTCRGWPLALQVAIAGRRARTGDPHLPSPLLSLQPSNLDDYLYNQVFADQPPEIQEFLLRSAGLRTLDAEVCNALIDLPDPAATLAFIQRRHLFLDRGAKGQLAYQPIFHAFLERLAARRLSDWRSFHMRVAEYYGARGDKMGLLHHLLAAGEGERAADALEQVAPVWLAQGWAETLLAWMARLPAPSLQRPALLEARATANRRLGRFEQALRIYERAEAIFLQQGDRESRVRMLRGRAEIYLDTVQPAPAVALLKQALKLLPRDRVAERVEILRLQAENWANRGRADVAVILENTARRLEQHRQGDWERGRHDSDDLSILEDNPAPQAPGRASSLPPRLLLRSGRLHEAREQLEVGLGLTETGDWRKAGEDATQGVDSLTAQLSTNQLGHREPLLLLALIYAMLGNGARALAMARRGLLEAQQGGSMLTEAIAQMRVGHAIQVVAPYDLTMALQRYRQALALVDRVGVTRTRAEVYLGMTLVYGHSGDLVAAEAVARDGLQVAGDAGDEWTTALLTLALGGAAVAAGDRQGPVWLEQARARFVRGGDSYGEAAVALWMALWYRQSADEANFDHEVVKVLTLARAYGYGGLLTAPTLFGPRDMAMLVPLLLRGRMQSEHASFAQMLLRSAFPSIAADETVDDYHPGYTLRIQMLGSFRVWRGSHEIQAREWQREKARQLFHLLLTYRGHWIQREQICAWLWPDSDLDAAERQFKVTLNALNAALEPQRPPRTAPFFIRRQGLAYSFAPSYGVWIDVDEFELRVTGAATQDDPDFALRSSQIAVQLYKGDYLAEALYDPWTLEERERLLARFLATATDYARRLSEQGDQQQAVQLCEQVLRRDRCYEEAYQVLMRAHARTGSRSQALRSYARCIHALRDDLGIEPLPETTALYERIKRNEKL